MGSRIHSLHLNHVLSVYLSEHGAVLNNELPWLKDSVGDECEDKDEEIEQGDHVDYFVDGSTDVSPCSPNLQQKMYMKYTE